MPLDVAFFGVPGAGTVTTVVYSGTRGGFSTLVRSGVAIAITWVCAGVVSVAGLTVVLSPGLVSVVELLSSVVLGFVVVLESSR